MTGILIDFNIPYFRNAFPEFGNTNAFPDAKLQMYWDWATYYVSNVNYGWLSNFYQYQPPGYARSYALNLMTAHLASIALLTASGELPGIAKNATIDKVQVEIVPPPIPNQWQYWLQTTPYGGQLLALLQVKSCGGFYTGGRSVQLAFRF